MSNIKKEELLKLASLSRIELSEDELNSFHKDIDSILAFITQIQNAGSFKSDSKNASGIFGQLENVMREDNQPHKTGVFSESILAEVPNKEDNYIKVKKII